jgi:hypothetical protein
LRKIRDCEELVILDGRSYLFSGTFGFLKSLKSKGTDPALVYDALTSGSLDVDHIFGVLCSSLEKISDESDIDTEEEVVQFIEKAGLQESAFIARLMLNSAMIGTVKKKQIANKEKIQEIQIKSQNFLSRTSTKLGLLLVVAGAISITLACTSFSFY